MIEQNNQQTQQNEQKNKQTWPRIGVLRGALHAYERGLKRGHFADKRYAESAERASAEIAVLRLKIAQMEGANG